MLDALTFADMESNFGPVLAFAYLEEIEKSAGITAPASFDPETRLRQAFALQDGSHASMRRPSHVAD